MHAMPEFTPADEHYIAAFEKRYAGQVNRFRQAQAAEAGSGLSFGQILALGLGAAALSQADISGVDAANIGGAFAADVLTGGKTGALASARSEQRRLGKEWVRTGRSRCWPNH